ncbi:MAG: hypothetical protein AAGG11_11765 [Pseudomonadota bacterium]
MVRTTVNIALLLAASAAPFAAHAQEFGEPVRARADSGPTQTIRLDETVISGNQELPKVLYILPWQTPEGMPELKVRADMAEKEVFRRLYPPAYRRELKYFDTLNRIQSEE